MLRDNLVGLIEPMPTARENHGSSLALSIHKHQQASDDRSSCLKNPRPAGAESSLTERTTPPFQTEPRHPSPTAAPPAWLAASTWLESTRDIRSGFDRLLLGAHNTSGEKQSSKCGELTKGHNLLRNLKLYWHGSLLFRGATSRLEFATSESLLPFRAGRVAFAPAA